MTKWDVFWETLYIFMAELDFSLDGGAQYQKLESQNHQTG